MECEMRLFSVVLDRFGTGGHGLFSCWVVPCHTQPPVVLQVVALVGKCKEKTSWSQEKKLTKEECGGVLFCFK